MIARHPPSPKGYGEASSLAWPTVESSRSIRRGPIIEGTTHEEEICTDLIKNYGIICFATSEPNMGSDVGGMICKATQDGDDWILNGKKYWITNAGYT